MFEPLKLKKFPKRDKDFVMEAIEHICIEDIGIEYRVKHGSDDGGSHIAVYFELEEGESLPNKAKSLLSSPFCGWRVIKLICPPGYLAAFFPLAEK
tara:strand:- start:276 stop:563 length:288 start_codon:yes stop_codon:yes gene_type:complete